MSWLDWFRQKKAAPTENGATLSETLSLRVTKREKLALEWWVKRTDQNLETWMRETLVRAVPQSAQQAAEASLLGPEILALVLEMAEAEDGDAPTFEPQPRAPAPATPQPRPELERLRAAPSDPLHTCVHLRKIYPHRLDARMCQGTCSSSVPAATGRICQWPAGAACECPYFEARLKSK